MSHNGHQSPLVDVAVIGTGPIGLELAVNLKQLGVDYIQFDAKQIGYTISWWPRNTPFFSTSERIALAGVPIQTPDQGRTTGEEYLAYLRSIVEQFDLKVNSYEKVIAIERAETGFTLRTQTLAEERSYRCRRVVIAKGDMDGPNWLEIPGEDLPHVSHYFIDPHLYFRRRLLIVGGRNSAVEAALRCWRAGAQVALSYRRPVLSEKVKAWLLPDLLAQVENGNIQFYPETVPVEITPHHVVLRPTQEGVPILDGPSIIHPTDFVLLASGFRADMSLFEIAGVRLEGPRRVPSHNPETMETNVPGLYIAGTAAAGALQDRYRLFIENSHEHVIKIVKALTGRLPDRIGGVSSRNYELALKQIETN